MEVYKISAPTVEPKKMSSINEDGTAVTQIELGYNVRGTGCTIVPVMGDVGAQQYRVKKTPDRGVVLCRSEEFSPEERCLVVINATGGYSKGRHYDVYNASNLTIIATGEKSWGAAGRAADGVEVLAIAEPGATFSLCSKYECAWYRWDGEKWTVETPERRNARMALEEVENGGGEWL